MSTQAKKSTISKNSFHAKVEVTWLVVTRVTDVTVRDEGERNCSRGRR